MSEPQRVGISELRVVAAPAVLITYGLGSCLATLIYDRERRLGGLAHTLLPRPPARGRDLRPVKYAASAIALMVEELLAQGAVREALAAKTFGGANMFEGPAAGPEESIGARNARAARETLEALEIPLLFEDIGGHHGRTVEFDLASGIVLVRSVAGGDTMVSF